MRLVMASANPHKVAEIAELLIEHQIAPRPSGMGSVLETEATLEGNARLKATVVCREANSAAVADDTGLEVDALAGLPGVRSARYAGEDATDAANLVKLLDRMKDVGEADRTARFRTVAIVVFPDGGELVAHGVAEGTICRAPHGDGGFGYDSIFVPDEGHGRTFAQMETDEKHAISHRGRAFRCLAEQLSSFSPVT